MDFIDTLNIEYFERKELASYLGVSTTTLGRWVKIGYGPPATKIGKRVVYRKYAVMDWIIDEENSPEADLPSNGIENLNCTGVQNQ